MKHNQTQLKKLQAAIQKDTKKESECRGEIERLTIQIESTRKLFNDLETKKQTEEQLISEIMAGLQEATQPLREKLEVVQISLGEAEKNVASIQSNKEVINTRIQLTQNRLLTATNSMNSVNEKLQSLESEKKSMEDQLNILQKRGTGLTREIKELDEKYVRLTAQESDLQAK